MYTRNETTLEIKQAPVQTSGIYQGNAIIDIFEYGVYTVWGIKDGVRKDYPSLVTVDTAKLYTVPLT